MAADVITHMRSAPASMLSFDAQSKLHFKLPRTDTFGAFLMIIKSIVGVGLFVLPWAFKTMGIGSAMLAMTVVAILTYYTGVVLMRVRDVIVRDTLQRDLTFVALTEHCFGRAAGYVVYFLVVFTTVGSLGAYLVFIGKVLASLTATSAPALSVQAWAGITALAVMPFCLARSTAFLAYTSVLGNLGVVLVVIVVFVRGGQLADFRPAAEYAAFNTPAFMQGFGVIGFVFACSTSLLTIEKSMANRKRFNFAFQSALVVVFVLCAAFGIVNYLYFGGNVCSIIVLNMGSGPLAYIAKIAIVIDLAFTYPMVLAPAREIVEKSFLDDSSSFLLLKQYTIRIIFIAITFAICFFPQMDIILNIVGGWSVSALAFILPCVMLLQLRRFHLQSINKQSEFLAEHKAYSSSSKGPHAAPSFRRDSKMLAIPDHTTNGLLPHEPTPKAHNGSAAMPSDKARATDPRHMLLDLDAAHALHSMPGLTPMSPTSASVDARIQELVRRAAAQPLRFNPWTGMSMYSLPTATPEPTGGRSVPASSPMSDGSPTTDIGDAVAAGASVAAALTVQQQRHVHDSVSAVGSMLHSLGRIHAGTASVRKPLPSWFPVLSSSPAATPAGPHEVHRYAPSVTAHKDLVQALIDPPRRNSGLASNNGMRRNSSGLALAAMTNGAAAGKRAPSPHPDGAKPVATLQHVPSRVDVIVHGHALQRPRIASDFDVVSSTSTSQHALVPTASATSTTAVLPSVVRHVALSIVPEGDEGAMTPGLSRAASGGTEIVDAAPAPAAAPLPSIPEPDTDVPVASPSEVQNGGQDAVAGKVDAFVKSPEASPNDATAKDDAHAANGETRRASATTSAGQQDRETDTEHHHHHHHRHHHMRRGSFIDAFGKQHRHKNALMMLGMGNSMEVGLLILVACFGVAALVLTTVQSIRDAVSAASEPAVCTA